VMPELAVCRETLENSLVSTTAIETAGAVEVTHVWDVGRVGLSLGAEAGGELIHETFTTSGHASPRNGPAFAFGALGKVEVHVTGRITVAAEIAAISYVLHRVGVTDVAAWATPLAARGTLGVGVAW
jgi:hypothetical protein